jgi:hypothetical protein
VTFGDATDFAIEAYHEPSGPDWHGCGRMALSIQGIRLGNIRDNHCSLHLVTERFRELLPTIESLWSGSFEGLTNREIFALIDRELYIDAPTKNRPHYARFDFLTNAGEMFDESKTFILCRPDGRVEILYQLRDDTFGSGACSAETFRSVAAAYVQWYDEQARAAAGPYFPINPFDPNENAD